MCGEESVTEINFKVILQVKGITEITYQGSKMIRPVF